MIKKFSCNNFRNLNFNDLELGHKINVLIGANNSGKSNFIKAISFLANMLIKWNGREGSAFLGECSRNGWHKQVCRSLTPPSEIDFKWTVDLEKENINYYLSFMGGQQEDCHIVKELMECSMFPSHENRPYNYFDCHSETPGIGYFSTVREKGKKNSRKKIEISNRDSVLFQFKDKLLAEKELYDNKDITNRVRPIIDEMSKYFRHFFSYSCTKFDLDKLRNPVNASGDSLYLVEDASNFLNVLNALIVDNIDNNSKFDDKLRELIHGFQMSRITPELNNLTMRLKYNKNQFDLTEVSDGTLKALVLNLILNMRINGGDISMLAIDEPELNLHPAWQKIVAHWILTSSTINQCFISTHSPDFLDVFTEDFMENRIGLYVFSSEGNIQKVCYNDIKSELDGWQLGDLYRAGEPLLGGWPW